MAVIRGRSAVVRIRTFDGAWTVLGTIVGWRMTKGGIENKLGFRFRKKSELRLMRAVAWLLNRLPKVISESGGSYVEEGRGDLFMTKYVTIYRLPFQKVPWAAYPDSWDVVDPRHRDLWDHEGIHAKDMSTAWGLFKMFWLVWLLPLPVVLSGRWYIERWALLQDIERGPLTLEQAADRLWRDYFFAWPKSWAIRWWKGQLEKRRTF